MIGEYIFQINFDIKGIRYHQGIIAIQLREP